MESKLVKLKSDFNNIINTRNTVKNVFETLKIRIDNLKKIYSEFIKNSKNDMFVFGLDSFHFQTKFIDIEYDDMMRLFLAINNRMYCEYFKLHKIIIEYIVKSINDKKITDLVNNNNNYPIYKDLEPFKEYKFELILDIHENILNMISILISFLNNKENELLIHKTKQNIGLNIDNFITTYNFNISVMREKIYMFTTYIEFFHKMHSKYLKRFSNKIQLMYTHITNDIKFDDTVEISKNKKKELIEDFVSNNMDKELLKELKTSIGSDTNSEVSSDNSNSPQIKIEEKIEKKINEILNKDNNINNTNNNISLLNIRTIEKKNKKDYRKIFQKNVNKLGNILNLYKPKYYKNDENKSFETKMTDNEIEQIFYGIEETCDSIINGEKPNDYLVRDIISKENPFDNSFFPIKSEEINDIHNFDDTIVQEEILILQEDKPNVQEENPNVQEEIPTVQEEMPTVQQEMPTVQEEIQTNDIATNILE